MPFSSDKDRGAATRQAIYEFFLDQNDRENVRLMEVQGVSVPDDDSNLRLRHDLFNLMHLGDKVEADGAAVLEQAVVWLDGLLREASLEADGPMINLRLEIRTQCVLTYLMPPNVLGKAAARNGKKALEKQFPKRDSGGSKGAEARESLRYKLLDKAIQECHERRVSDLQKTLELHSFGRMLKALENQLPRVKLALELPEPQILANLGGGVDDYDEHGNPALDEVSQHRTTPTPRPHHRAHATRTLRTPRAHPVHTPCTPRAHPTHTPCTPRAHTTRR